MITAYELVFSKVPVYLQFQYFSYCAMNIVAKARKWPGMAVWVTGALPLPYPPYLARRPDVPDGKHFPDVPHSTDTRNNHTPCRVRRTAQAEDDHRC
jgi:hypothetical protein